MLLCKLVNHKRTETSLKHLFIWIGVGKTSLVHLITKASSITRPAQTIGCSVNVKVTSNFLVHFWSDLKQSLSYNLTLVMPNIFFKILFQHITYGSPSSSSNSIKGDADRDFFVELWDISGHDRYRDCRSLFYTQINGKILN